jgi:hypothetical protein
MKLRSCLFVALIALPVFLAPPAWSQFAGLQREVQRLPNGNCPQGARVVITSTPGGAQIVHCVMP